MTDSAIELENFSNATIRRLLPSDRSAILQHFQHLDNSSLRMRFGAAVNKEFAKKYASRVLEIDTVVFGTFIDHHLRGLAELRVLQQMTPASAEAAFSVESPWQNMGIGNALVQQIVADAQSRRIKTLYMMWLSDNQRMQHLALKQSAKLRLDPQQTEAVIHLSQPNFSSVMQKLFKEKMGLLSHAFD